MADALMPGRHERRGRHESPAEVFTVRDRTGRLIHQWDTIEELPATRGNWCLQHDSTFDRYFDVCDAVGMMREGGRSTFIECIRTEIGIEVVGA